MSINLLFSFFRLYIIKQILEFIALANNFDEIPLIRQSKLG